MRSSRKSYDGPVSDHFDGAHFFDPNGVPPKSLQDVLRWQLIGQRRQRDRCRPTVGSRRMDQHLDVERLQAVEPGFGRQHDDAPDVANRSPQGPEVVIEVEFESLVALDKPHAVEAVAR